MAAETKARPFWRVRRFWGGVFGVTGAALTSIPGAPVIATIGAVALTTQTIGIVAAGIGTYVFGYGQGRATERKAGE